MKTLILLSFFISGSALACSCSYDYGHRDSSILKRASALINVDAKAIQVNDYTIKYTAASVLDPASYGSRSCGCTSFVKRIWDVSFTRNDQACDGTIINSVWNDALKIKNIVCK